MSLATYRAKRKFNETPEPQGGKSGRGEPLRYVVQMHQASRLHFDFRLEIDGVLKSWAVPKGPSLNPADKRLAMMVEDHPFDYRTFEGTIPAGNYGAGTVMVWDEGFYHAPGVESREESESALRRGLENGRLSFVLEGQKLRGEFSLVKLHRGEANAWLLMKKKDDAADAKFKIEERSAVTGRTLAEIAAGKAARRISDPSPSRKRERRMAGPSLTLPARTSKAHQGAHAPRSPRRKSTFIEPMLTSLVDEPFDRKGWIFEMKWDGYRAIAEKRGGELRLYSRNQKSFLDHYPTLVESLQAIDHDFIMDGEICSLDEQGQSQFQLLQNYRRTGEGNLVYCVFDLLELDGKDLRPLPLRERKKRLAKILPRKSLIQFSEHIEEKGLAFFKEAAKRRLEGIVAKNAESAYREGRRTLDWLKIKTHRRQEAVIGGFTEPKGGRKLFGALVLGVYEAGELVYIGHTGGGFNGETLRETYERMKPLQQKACPFIERPRTNTPAHWVRPELICEVNFQEWTDEGQMRQPIFVGLREDKDPKDVKREMDTSTKRVVEKARPRRREPSKGGWAPTNLDKVFFPEEGITKGDLLEYYGRVAKFILPYMRDRPQSLNRHPNGYGQQNFFQKDVSKQPPPEWVETVTIQREDCKKLVTPLCQNEQSLLYFVNLGCIEMNPWNARVGHLDNPDYLVIDLDPEDIEFKHVVEAAKQVHEVLEGIGAKSVCKTSGKTGLHIFVPLGARYSVDVARQFAELVAAHAHQALPDTTSLERRPINRQQRVYLDYLQNSHGQTLAAPYSVRPHPGATASTPLKWSEVNGRLDPSRYTIRTVPKRLDKIGDLWKPVLGKGIELEKCLKRLS